MTLLTVCLHQVMSNRTPLGYIVDRIYLEQILKTALQTFVQDSISKVKNDGHPEYGGIHHVGHRDIPWFRQPEPAWVDHSPLDECQDGAGFAGRWTIATTEKLRVLNIHLPTSKTASSHRQAERVGRNKIVEVDAQVPLQ